MWRQLVRPMATHQHSARLNVNRSRGFCSIKKPEFDSPSEQKVLTMWQKFMLATLPYRIGSRKLVNNMKVAYYLLSDSVMNMEHKMTRRERRLVLRTIFDISKLLPFAAIAAAPGGSLLLPVLAKFIPSSLPTTFNMPSEKELERAYQTSQEELKVQNRMDKGLKNAIEKLVKSMHQNQVRENKQLHRLISHAMSTESISSGKARLLYTEFSDGDLLEVLNINQLTRLATYFNRTSSILEKVATDRYRYSILHYSLTKYTARINSEDIMLAEEKPSSLNDTELEQACIMRGLYHPSDGPCPGRQILLSRLNEWTMASVGMHIPVVLLAFANMNDAYPDITSPNNFDAPTETTASSSGSSTFH